MFTPEDLQRMDGRERAALMRALTGLAGADPYADPLNRQRRAGFLTILTVCCLVLAGWIVFLAVNLPRQYAAEQWQLAWIGFDIGLLAALGGTAWAVWRRRQLAVVGVVVSGTLLSCDAWFDVSLSWGRDDLPVTLATALLGELPLAALMFFTAWRLLTLTIRTVWVRSGHDGPVPPLRKVRMFTIAEPGDAAGRPDGPFAPGGGKERDAG
ncbi:hypothetical protein ACRYCC_13470 [Actinomadura scrupuli]|uniref:hypothetical protein n=1 Tax=Actinomadura scrupuli TaxID=559629 RepID=UPI003D99B8D1